MNPDNKQVNYPKKDTNWLSNLPRIIKRAIKIVGNQELAGI